MPGWPAKALAAGVLLIAVALVLSGSLLSCMRGMMGMHGMMGGRQNDGSMGDMMQQMMGGMLPPGIDPRNLPEPESRGAALLKTYCTQCHRLPSPAMHQAEDWPRTVGRMVARDRMMSGMRGMMMSVKAPTPEEVAALMTYLQQHALRAFPPGVPLPDSPGSAPFQQTCTQCHALPDPSLHTGAEWATVVERMRSHMGTMGKLVITPAEADEILRYLANGSRKSHGTEQDGLSRREP